MSSHLSNGAIFFPLFLSRNLSHPLVSSRKLKVYSTSLQVLATFFKSYVQGVPSLFKHFRFDVSQTRIQLSLSSPYWSLSFFVIRINASLPSAYSSVESSHGIYSAYFSSFSHLTSLNFFLLQTTRSPVLFRNSLLPSVGTILFHSGDGGGGWKGTIVGCLLIVDNNKSTKQTSANTDTRFGCRYETTRDMELMFIPLNSYIVQRKECSFD